MGVYFYDGGILFNSGDIAFNEDCCCGSVEQCTHCDTGTTPSTIQVILGTVTDNSCNQCDELFSGKTFICTQHATNYCLWQYMLPGTAAWCYADAVSVNIWQSGFAIRAGATIHFETYKHVIWTGEISSSSPADCLVNGVGLDYTTGCTYCTGGGTATITAI